MIAEDLFTNAAGHIGLPISELALVLVADDSRYAEAIQRVQPGGGFTDHPSGYRGMGKTGTILESGGTYKSAVVIHLNALGGALTPIFATVDMTRDSTFEQNCTYLVYHELGHCLDNLSRPDRPSPPAVREGRGFAISQFERYHAHLVEEEYAASHFAVHWMTPQVYRDLFGLLCKQLESGRAEAHKLKLEYAENPDVLTRLASSVAGWCWSLLIQFAKLAASRSDNNALLNASPIWPEEDDDIVVQLLREFDQELARHWAEYPTWTSEPPRFMPETWQTLASFEGFRFIEDERGSAVFW